MHQGLIAIVSLLLVKQPGSAPLDGVTFANKPALLLVPVKDVGAAFKLPITWQPKKGVSLNGVPVKEDAHLLDGTVLVAVSGLKAWGITAEWNQETHTATLKTPDAETAVRNGDKRVIVDKARQVLEAYQGDRLVLTTPISTGRPGHNTPIGDFNAGPVKDRMHYSRLYDNAPMPWAVEVDGNVFIHGYHSVPPYPASHGCVRMPLNHGNPAKWFFHWVDVGTPVTISGTWVWKPTHSTRHHRRRHR